MQPIKITIVEPNGLLREGLRSLLRDPPFQVVDAVRVVTEASQLSTADKPHLVLWGPGASGNAPTEVVRLRECGEPGHHPIRFVLLADLVDVGWIRRAAAMGVDAVLSQDISSDILQRSLHLVVLGQQLFPAALAHAPNEAAAMAPSDLIPFPMPAIARPIAVVPERLVVLTEREGQILRCLVDGATNKEIARLLRMNEATVKGHLKRLLRKTSVSNRTQAAIWAQNNNICVAKAIGEVTSLSAPASASRAA